MCTYAQVWPLVCSVEAFIFVLIFIIACSCSFSMPECTSSAGITFSRFVVTSHLHFHFVGVKLLLPPDGTSELVNCLYIPLQYTREMQVSSGIYLYKYNNFYHILNSSSLTTLINHAKKQFIATFAFLLFYSLFGLSFLSLSRIFVQLLRQ